MKKIIVLLVTCSWSFNALSATSGVALRWTQGKITNNTKKNIEVKVKYTLNCNNVTPAPEKTKCTSSGNVLILRVSAGQTIAMSDINAVKSISPQTVSTEHGLKNTLHVKFPAEQQGTLTYAPLSYDVPYSDLDKTPKNFTISLAPGNVMKIQPR